MLCHYSLFVPPLITFSLVQSRPYEDRRNVINDVVNIGRKAVHKVHSVLPNLDDDVHSVLSNLEHASLHVASAFANFFQDLSTGKAVLSSLSVDHDFAAVPTQVLNIPGYANYTNEGWNLRIHGNVYKQPKISEFMLNFIARLFLFGTSLNSLTTAQASQARTVTAELLVVQQANENVTLSLTPAAITGTQPEDGSAQTINFPYLTTFTGDFDAFVPIQSYGLLPGNDRNTPIQRLNIHTEGTDTGDATSWLVPDKGLTVISDVDDILRITKVYMPREGLFNTFAKAFTPWMNMPAIYASWASSHSDLHFHYLTTTPEQLTRTYMDFIYKTYPGGSFDTRPLNFGDVSAMLNIRKFLLNKIFQTFPQRKFILVADTSNPDVLKAYPAMVTDFPGQVQCIFLRNTSATDPSNHFPYDTRGFKNVDPSLYMFFHVPDDLKGLDIANGQCINSSVRQDITFSYQGLPLGLSKKNVAKRVREYHGRDNVTETIC